MIFNKSENKVFTFSYTDDSDVLNPRQVDVTEMKYCRKLDACVYAFSLEEKTDTMKIGLVDIQTGTVVEPMFAEIWRFSEYKCVGLCFHGESSSFCQISTFGESSSFCQISTFGDLTIDYISTGCTTTLSRNASGYYQFNGCCFEVPAEYDFFDYGEESAYSRSGCVHEIDYRLSPDSKNEYDSWIEKLVIDFKNAFCDEGNIDIYCQGGYLIERDGRYFLNGERLYNFRKMETKEELFSCYGLETRKYALTTKNSRITGYDFTEEPYAINDELNLIVVEIYGKLGVLRYTGDGLRSVLPIEFSSVQYHGEGRIKITDGIDNTETDVKSGFFVAKMGMRAWFSLEGEQLTPFVREEYISYEYEWSWVDQPEDM